VSVVKGEREREQGRFEKIYLVGEIYKRCRYWGYYIVKAKEGEREQGRFEKYT